MKKSILMFLFVGLLILSLKISAQNDSKSVKYAGSELCASCHDKIHSNWLKTLHGKAYLKEKSEPKMGCESCHGPGEEHQGDPEKIINLRKIKSDKIVDICLDCHKKEIEKGQWIDTIHSKEKLSCITCHNPHKNTDKFLVKEEKGLCFDCHSNVKLEFKKNSHHPVLEGRLKCSNCHILHNSNIELAKTKERDMLCFKCHYELQGPYLYTHKAITGGISEGCKSCHKPHGSSNDKLLTIKEGRGLCLQCHTDRISHGGISCTECHKSKTSGHKGQNCTNCHTKIHKITQNCIECHNEIHGSNTDKLLGGSRYQNYFNQ